MNALPLPDSIGFALSEENVLVKQPIKTAIDTDITNFYCFAFPLLLIFEHALPPSLNPNHNACSIFLRIHMKCESRWHAPQRGISALPELGEWTLPKHRSVEILLYGDNNCKEIANKLIIEATIAFNKLSKRFDT